MSASHPGQLLLAGIPGTSMTSATAALIRKVQPGGFILFGRNLVDANQLRKLIEDLRSLVPFEPVITIDQEGGRVSRLRLIGMEPPSASQIAATGDLSLATRHGELTAGLLRLFGFNLDLCPVLDLHLGDEADNSLRGRCYGSTVDEVEAMAGAFNDALRKGGVLSCGKHFPGYSAAPLDPHENLPVIDVSLDKLQERELEVFRRFADRVDSMMIGHAFYPALQPPEEADVPSSLSPTIISQLLKQRIGFRGLVMTDDLDMGAILETFGHERALQLALAAGCDLLMICHQTDALPAARQVLERCPTTQIDRALQNLLTFSTLLQPATTYSEDRFAQLNAEVWDLRLAVLGEELAAVFSVEDGKRSPVETY